MAREGSPNWVQKQKKVHWTQLMFGPFRSVTSHNITVVLCICIHTTLWLYVCRSMSAIYNVCACTYVCMYVQYLCRQLCLYWLINSGECINACDTHVKESACVLNNKSKNLISFIIYMPWKLNTRHYCALWCHFFCKWKCRCIYRIYNIASSVCLLCKLP